MSENIVLPALGESVTEGTVTRWLKEVGEEVAVDEPLLEVSTDKVDTEIPSPVSGVLEEILVEEDETVEVGAVLARVGDGSGASAPAAEPQAEAQAEKEPQPEPETPQAREVEPEREAKAEPIEEPEPEPQPAAPAPAEQPPHPEPSDSPSVPSQSAPPSGSGYVTPIVRKLANESGIDLASVVGTGVGGRIRKEDVEAAVQTSSAKTTPQSAQAVPTPVVETSPLRGTTEPMSRLRKVISERAVASLNTTAQLTTMVEVDVTRVVALRTARKDEFLRQTGSKLSYLPFFAVAAAEALRTYPVLNASVDGDNIVYPDTENMSIAVDTERGLLAPVLRDVGDKNIAQISAEVADLADRTRKNKLSPDELAGGTFTLTNTGSRGALFDTPLVFLPQSAILGTGTVVKKPAVISGPDGDAIAIRSTVYLALSYDHRIIDGADAARFLTQMKNRLEEGNFESTLGI